jgi:hypothetical protein
VAGKLEMTSSHLKRYIRAKQRHETELERYIAFDTTTSEPVEGREPLNGDALKCLQELAESEYQAHAVWIQDLRERLHRRGADYQRSSNR